MQLIMSPTSPYVRKVRVMIREADLTDVIEEIEVSTTAYAPDTKAVSANPLGKIPTLLRSDGPAIYDSRNITRFLDDYANANLYPASRLWEILTLEATADGIKDATVSMAYEVRLRPETEQSRDWIEAQWVKAARAIDTISERWMSHLQGPLNMGQIATACALSYVDLRHDARNWRDGHAALADWHAAFCERPSMAETAPA
ncbi:glutathione S-transferase [Cognatiyoonia koreensis]|uniref:Glutathione S-transferase n=1 Tax=Cognatiyoonia koreensis TaxID=364200 RepID=A0A1I0RRQ8_9RHOB|nr:glutathione S-transferase family protein [Cognatiyoonia koreensis]SEW44030.1 glutathione S-transferase [Cognatiyoonia koreensis]